MSFIRTHGCADTEDDKSESVYVAILTPAAATFITILLLVILIFDNAVSALLQLLSVLLRLLHLHTLSAPRPYFVHCIYVRVLLLPRVHSTTLYYSIY